MLLPPAVSVAGLLAMEGGHLPGLLSRGAHTSLAPLYSLSVGVWAQALPQMGLGTLTIVTKAREGATLMSRQSPSNGLLQ